MNYKSMLKSMLLLCFAGNCSSIFAQQVEITVSNPTDVQRQELIEINISDISKKLKQDASSSYIIKNKRGQQVGFQTTHDGKLLIDASVRPHGVAYFYVTTGFKQPQKVFTTGALYKIRKDDIAWENDRCAYRVYGPALQRTGERSFGTDIWVKNTPDTVVYDRYIKDMNGNILGDKLEKEGRKAEADSVDLATSFHLDHGNGLDAYRVGATLGLGAPALMVGDSLAFPYCYKDYEILDNGPLRFTVSLTYNPSTIGKDKNVIEHRIISLDKGSNFNKMIVWYEGLKHAAPFATGVVVHEEDTTSLIIDKTYVAYADPTDDVERNNSQLYVAALFPNGISQTKFHPFTHRHDGATGHALGILNQLKENQRFTYYFGAAWSKYDIRSFNEWKLRIEEYMNALKTPLTVTVH